MPSKSLSQKKLMAIAAKDPEFAKKVGIDPKIAEEWHAKDKEAEQQGKQKDLPEHVKPDKS